MSAVTRRSPASTARRAVLWASLVSAPIAFWMALWFLLPGPVFFALLASPGALALLVACRNARWEADPEKGRRGLVRPTVGRQPRRRFSGGPSRIPAASDPPDARL